jgi:hypothetical protein
MTAAAGAASAAMKALKEIRACVIPMSWREMGFIFRKTAPPAR